MIAVADQQSQALSDNFGAIVTQVDGQAGRQICFETVGKVCRTASGTEMGVWSPTRYTSIITAG